MGVTIVVFLLFSLLSDKALMARLLSMFTDMNLILRNDSEAYHTGSQRWYLWQKTLILIKEYPVFGVGIENLGNVFPQKFADEMIKTFGYVLSVDKAHNEYLDQMVSSGIPSLLLYLGFLFSILKVGFNKLKDDPIKIALMSSIIGYCVQAFFNIRVVTVAYVFWIFLGLILNEPSNSSKKTTAK
jgi:putative inorganic carbon (HCO3(-)) transporter